MRRFVLGILDGVSIFCAKLGILDCDRLVHGRVSGDIRCIMCQSAKAYASWVRTEYAKAAPLDISAISRSASARMQRHKERCAGGIARAML